MPPNEQRVDLAAQFARVTRRLNAAEEPLLTGCGVTMWEYIVLSQLELEPARNQLTLARQVRHDKSRLIPLLDGLETRGLIQRDRDPADRRSHSVLLTDAGRHLLLSARSEIRGMEEEILSVLSAAERKSLFAALNKLGHAAQSDNP